MENEKNESTPRAEISIFCDTYSTQLKVEHHNVELKEKVKITISDQEEPRRKPISLSLHQEELDHLIEFLETARPLTSSRR